MRVSISRATLLGMVGISVLALSLSGCKGGWGWASNKKNAYAARDKYPPPSTMHDPRAVETAAVGQQPNIDYGTPSGPTAYPQAQPGPTSPYAGGNTQAAGGTSQRGFYPSEYPGGNRQASGGDFRGADPGVRTADARDRAGSNYGNPSSNYGNPGSNYGNPGSGYVGPGYPARGDGSAARDPYSTGNRTANPYPPSSDNRYPNNPPGSTYQDTPRYPQQPPAGSYPGGNSNTPNDYPAGNPPSTYGNPSAGNPSALGSGAYGDVPKSDGQQYDNLTPSSSAPYRPGSTSRDATTLPQQDAGGYQSGGNPSNSYPGTSGGSLDPSTSAYPYGS